MKTPRKVKAAPRKGPASDDVRSEDPALGGVLSNLWKPAFNAMPRDILEATSQQFSEPLFLYRELAQNSQDSGARQVQCTFRMEDIAADVFTFAATWIDNGAGMTRDVIDTAYLRIFSSTKELTRNETVGYFSLGRLIVFALVPNLIAQETVTLPEAAGEAGTLVRILPDGGGEVHELSREEASATIGPLAPKHGTKVTVTYRVNGGEAEFVAEVGKSVDSIRRECRWVRPRLTVSTVRRDAPAADGKPGALVWGTEVINQPFGVPGRLSKSYSFELSSGRGKGTVSIGVRPDEKDPMPDLFGVTLTAGGIPLERTSAFPWSGGDDEYTFCNLRTVLESYQWRPPVGRHRARRDEPFFQEVVPKVLHGLILGRFVPWLCAKMKDPRERRGLFGYLRNIEIVLFDILYESTRGHFEIPESLLDLPLFRRFGSWGRKAYSVRDLDAASRFWYTYQKPDIQDLRESFVDNAVNQGADASIVLDLHGTLFASSFIERRYGAKAENVNEPFFCEEDTGTMGAALQASLRDDVDVRQYLVPPFRAVCAGRFLKLGGHVPETTRRAYAQKSQHRVVLNLNNPDLASMAALVAQGGTAEDRWLGQHLLLREVLLVDGLDLTESKRQQALQEHSARQHGGSTGAKNRPPRSAGPSEQVKWLRALLGERGKGNIDDLLAALQGDVGEHGETASEAKVEL